MNDRRSFGLSGADGRIETACPDCDDPIAIEVTDAVPDDETLLFHSLVPAADWVPRTRDQNQAILDGLGLLGDAWRLP